MTSVVIEKPALAYQNFPLLIHVPFIDLLKAFVTGVHWKIVAVTDAMQYMTMIINIKRHAHLSHLVGPNILRYNNKMDALVELMLALYVTWHR